MPVKKNIQNRVLAAVILAGFSVPLTAAAHPELAPVEDAASQSSASTTPEAAAKPAGKHAAPTPEQQDIAPAEDTEPLPTPEPVQQPVEQPAPVVEEAPAPAPVAEPAPAPEPVAELPPAEAVQSAAVPAQEAPPAPASVESEVEVEAVEQPEDPAPAPRATARTAMVAPQADGQKQSGDINEDADQGETEATPTDSEPEDNTGTDGDPQEEPTPEPEPEPEPTRTEIKLPGGTISIGNLFERSNDDAGLWFLDISGDEGWHETTDFTLIDANGVPIDFELIELDGSFRLSVSDLVEDIAHAIHFNTDEGRTTMIVGSGDVPTQVITGEATAKVNNKAATVSLSNLAEGVAYSVTIGDTSIEVIGQAGGTAEIDLNSIAGFDPDTGSVLNISLTNSLGLHVDGGSQSISVGYTPPPPPAEPEPEPDEPGDEDDKQEPGTGTPGGDDDTNTPPGGDGEPTDPTPSDPTIPGTNPGGDGDTPGGELPGPLDPGTGGDQTPGDGGQIELPPGEGGHLELPGIIEQPGNSDAELTAGRSNDDTDDAAEELNTAVADNTRIDAFGDLQTAMGSSDHLASQSDELPLATAGGLEFDLLESASSDSLLSGLTDRGDEVADDTDDSELDVFSASPEPSEPGDDRDDVVASDQGSQQVSASSGWLTGMMIALISGIVTVFAWLVLGKKRRGDHAEEA